MGVKVPPLPGKKSFIDEKDLENRKLGLQQFL